MQRKWSLRLVTALLWALAAASAVYWVLRLSSPSAGPASPAMMTGAGDNAARKTSIARLLGAQNPQNPQMPVVAAINRFTLAGVVSQGRNGAALLVVDGKPARPYRVGAFIDENTVLQSVGPRGVTISSSPDGPVLQTLEMPRPALLGGVGMGGSAHQIR